MRRIISVLFLCISTTVAFAGPSEPLVLADNAPDRYTVVRGDTLWGLSSKYLKDAYRWPVLWGMNKQEIKNPHWIYPGQVLVLDRSGAEPRLRLGGKTGAGNTEKLLPKEYIEPIEKPIASIPPNEIEPFLSQPLVVDEASLAQALRVVGLQDNRVIVGAGDVIYTTPYGASGGLPADAAKGEWHVFRQGRPLADPQTKEVLGFEAQFLGNARMTATGEVTTFKLLTAKEEVLTGDFLLPAPRMDVVNYMPHAPEKNIAGRVISIYGGVYYGGPQSVVVLNKGKKDGVDLGQVFAIDKAGVILDDRFKGKKTSYTLPDERNSLVFVFRTFDRVAYALVMSAKQPIVVGDAAHTP